ncbi:5231_t:CDS:2, partial [Entrophospora sp. SA101]
LTPIKNLWAKARPSFKLPGRKKLSTTLLDNVYEETKQEVDKLIEEAEYYSLVSDGWSSITQEHWTNYILTTPAPVFIKATLLERFAKQVMKKAWSILMEKYPSIIYIGCISHSLNLLIGDIIKLDWVDGFLKKSKSIVKFFKSHNIPSAVFKRYQQNNNQSQASLKLPVKTRWGSSVMCLESLIQNRLALELTVTELSRNINVDVKSSIQSGEFWDNIISIHGILNKVFIGIKLFESDEPKLGLFYEWYQNLLNAQTNFDNEIKDIIKKRWKKIYSPVMLVAYLLNPRISDHKLPEN